MKRALIVFAGLFVVFLASDAWACSCAMRGTVRESIDMADAVFLGEVTDVRRAEPAWVTELRFLKARVLRSVGIDDTSLTYWYNGPRYGMVAKLVVLRDWKGSPGKTVEIRTGYGGGDCGFPFDVTKAYVVYAYYAGGYYFTGICGRTTLASSAKEEIAELDALER